jgi:hypothetical protein
MLFDKVTYQFISIQINIKMVLIFVENNKVKIYFWRNFFKIRFYECNAGQREFLVGLLRSYLVSESNCDFTLVFVIVAILPLLCNY